MTFPLLLPKGGWRTLSTVLASGEFPNYDPLTWVDIALAVFVCLFIIVICFFFFKKKAALVFFISALTLLIACFIFNLNKLALILCVLVTIVGIQALFFNMESIRENLQNPSMRKRFRFNDKTVQSAIPVYDKKKFYSDVTTAVLKLSSTKTGAIMTFEKKMPLDSFMQNGTIINSPFTPELVETIFYVGTRLHDGAIIVRKNLIIAASVYYTPSTKALTGKFGARHRAALGISEGTDSVTVVCSEETGRISIAYNGKLESVRRDEFADVFREYMNL